MHAESKWCVSWECNKRIGRKDRNVCRLTCYYCTLRPDNYDYAHKGPPLVKTFEIDVDNVACGYSVINTTVVPHHLAP